MHLSLAAQRASGYSIVPSAETLKLTNNKASMMMARTFSTHKHDHSLDTRACVVQIDQLRATYTSEACSEARRQLATCMRKLFVVSLVPTEGGGRCGVRARSFTILKGLRPCCRSLVLYSRNTGLSSFGNMQAKMRVENCYILGS